MTLLLREDLVLDFRSRGLISLSGAIEEFLEVFLSAIPTECRRRSSKETRELVRRFLEGKPVQENTLQECLQQLITLLQTLPSQQTQTSQPQQETHQETQPPIQPEPTTQEPKQINPQKPKQKTRRKTKEN
jgi:hypothetical protein